MVCTGVHWRVGGLAESKPVLGAKQTVEADGLGRRDLRNQKLVECLDHNIFDRDTARVQEVHALEPIRSFWRRSNTPNGSANGSAR